MATRQLIQPDSLGQTDLYHHVCVSEGRRMINVSGQVAFDRDRNLLGGDDLEAQTRHAFRNLQTALEAGGGTLENLVKIIYYIVYYIVDYKPEQREIIAKVWKEIMPWEKRPPATLIGVQCLAVPGLLIEIDGLAVID